MAIALQQLLNREKSVSDHVPYTIHASSENIRTSNGDMLTVIKLDGAAHEAADMEDVAAWHSALHGMVRNAASGDVAMWRHTIRRENKHFPGGEFHTPFAEQLNAKYRASFLSESMMQNDLYLTFVVRGPRSVAKLFGKTERRERDQVLAELAQQSAQLDEIARNAMASLSRYGAERLSCYEYNGLQFSKPLEFLSFLVNGTWDRVALPRGPLNLALPRNRLSFGVESGELRGITERKLFAIISITEYPEVTETGLLNPLLTVPFEYTLTHSYACIDKPSALSMVKAQQRKLINTKDVAGSQIADLDDAMDAIQSNRIGLGEHHFSILVTAPDESTLVARLAELRANLSDCGFTAVREDLAIEAAYWAQLPGNFKYRPRPAPISSMNFVGLAALHNYPVGQAKGNQWGPALSVVRTTSGSPFFINLHLPVKGKRSDGRETDDERVAGNTLLVGPTGSGKTVDQTFLLAQAEKYKPTVFTFDKDYGQENFIRAMGGQYSVLKIGERTGYNPFHLPPSPATIAFLEDLVQFLSGGRLNLTPKQLGEIQMAVRGVMSMPFETRRLSTILQFLPNVESNGPAARLQRWCNEGSLSWVFDNAHDTLTLTDTRHFGFDVTEFLDNDEIRTPIIMYLFHRMESLIGKNRFILNMDEFWKMLGDPYFMEKANDIVKTIRKRDGLAIFGTQSPQDVLRSPIAHSLVEQCVTQIFKPNPKAEYRDYVEGFKLTQREFQIIKSDMPASNMRGFLFKQGTNSVVCELNLAGFSDELAILSSTASSVELCRRAIARAGNDPELWMPVFHQYRRGL
jgi:type IV secretion system protein VirB4